MDVSDDTFNSFTPYRQEGIAQHEQYYSRNGYLKPPQFKSSDTWIHVRTGLKFQEIVDPSFRAHLSIESGENGYYIRIPSRMTSVEAQDIVFNQSMHVRNIRNKEMTRVLNVRDFFLDAPTRKIGYVRVAV